MNLSIQYLIKKLLMLRKTYLRYKERAGFGIAELDKDMVFMKMVY
jgi:hypothetical protein